MQFLKNDNVYITNKEAFLAKLKKFSLNQVHIISDFDRTITSGDSFTSWSLFARSGLMPDDYIRRRDAYFAEYHPIEIGNSLSEKEKQMKMREWWQKHLDLLVEFKLSREVVEKVSDQFMTFREGIGEFITFIQEQNIPLIIMSAGIANTIEYTLKNHGYIYDELHIVSNTLKFNDQEEVVGFDKDMIIHSANKDEHDLPISLQYIPQERKDIILLGDSLDDLKMVEEDRLRGAIKIGFCEDKDNLDKYSSLYDVVLTDNSSFAPVLKILKKIA